MSISIWANYIKQIAYALLWSLVIVAIFLAIRQINTLIDKEKHIEKNEKEEAIKEPPDSSQSFEIQNSNAIEPATKVNDQYSMKENESNSKIPTPERIETPPQKSINYEEPSTTSKELNKEKKILVDYLLSDYFDQSINAQLMESTFYQCYLAETKLGEDSVEAKEIRDELAQKNEKLFVMYSGFKIDLKTEEVISLTKGNSENLSRKQLDGLCNNFKRLKLEINNLYMDRKNILTDRRILESDKAQMSLLQNTRLVGVCE